MRSTDAFKQDIASGQLRRLYYIHGDENYLKRLWLGRIKKSLFGDEEDPADLHRIDGKDGDVSAFADLLETVPLFSSRKLIIISDAPANGDFCGYITKNPDSLQDDTVLVFYAHTEPFDTRLKDYKAVAGLISEIGLDLSADTPAPQDLEKWVGQLFARHRTGISSSDIKYFISQAGTCMDVLDNEAEKLCAFCDGNVTRQAIDTVTVKTVDARTYELVDAVLDKNSNKAREVLRDLLAVRTDCILILGSVFTAVSNLYRVKLYVRAGLGSAEIARKTGMKQYPAEKYIKRVSGIGFPAISAMLDMCCKADMECKSTVIDGEIILSRLIAEMSEVL